MKWICHPCALWVRGLTSSESCRRAAAAVVVGVGVGAVGVAEVGVVGPGVGGVRAGVPLLVLALLLLLLGRGAGLGLLRRGLLGVAELQELLLGRLGGGGEAGGRLGVVGGGAAGPPVAAALLDALVGDLGLDLERAERGLERALVVEVPLVLVPEDGAAALLDGVDEGVAPAVDLGEEEEEVVGRVAAWAGKG